MEQAVPAGDASVAERLWVEENCPEGTKEDQQGRTPTFGFVGHAHLTTSDSKGRKKALVAIGRFRVHVIVKSKLGKKKVNINVHLLDLLEINGSKESLNLVYCSKRTPGYHLHCTLHPNGNKGCKKQFNLMATTMPHFLLALRMAYDRIAPTFLYDFVKIGLNPNDLLPFTPMGAQSIAAGFIETYQAYCDLRKCPVSQQAVSYIRFLVDRMKSTDLNLIDIPGIHSSAISFDIGSLFGALEQNQYFTSLQVESISGHKDMLLYAANVLRRNETLTRMSLIQVDPCPHNYFTEFCVGLRFNPTSAIQMLVLRGCNIGTAGAISLADALENLKHGLPVLDISSCQISPKGMLPIFSALMRNFAMSLTITSLDISSNKCDEQCSDLFARWLNAIQEYSPLKRLIISDLSLNYTMIGSALRHFKCLAELNISNNKLDHAGCQLVRTICEMSRTLTTLDVSSCKLAGEHVALIAKAVSENSSLVNVRLNFAKNDFFKKDSATLANYLRSCKNISYLDLSSNKFHNRSMEEILGSLVDVSTLRTLILDHACKEPDAQTATALSSLLSQNTHIRALRIAGGWGKVAEILLPLLTTNETLEVLDISGNKMGDAGAAHVANLLSSNGTIKQISLDENQFSISGFQAIALGLVTNTTLEQLKFPWQDFEKACNSIPSPKQPHLDRLRQSVIEVQVGLMRNMNGHSSLPRAFGLDTDISIPFSPKPAPLAQVPADLVAVQNEAPPLPPHELADVPTSIPSPTTTNDSAELPSTPLMTSMPHMAPVSVPPPHDD